MLYIHIPFCRGKCVYCDFYSGGNPDWDAFLRALSAEFDERLSEFTDISSVYIGGGTPSLLPPAHFTALVDLIRRKAVERGLAPGDAPIFGNSEFTLEVNPEDVSEANAKLWSEAGVNRISMGIQSLDDDELAFMKRRHNAQKAIDTYNLLKRYFNNISVDIIYGIPFTQSHGSGDERLSATLQSVLSLRPVHISAYALTFEGNTPLQFFKRQGKVSPLSDDEYNSQGQLVADALENAGYERYEISNFALPGFHSRHNSGYWTGKPYLGLGPAASSYDGMRVRRTNPSDLKAYLRRFDTIPPSHLGRGAGGEAPRTPFYTEEILTDMELAEEALFLALRTREGLDLNFFGSRFGQPLSAALRDAAQNWLSTADAEISANRLRLTPKGWQISDYIISSLLSHLEN